MSIIVRLALAAAIISCIGGTVRADDAPMSIPGATTLDANGVVNLVQNTGKLVIVDNRKEGDYTAGHIEGAVRLIDTDITGPEVLAKVVPTKDTPVLFYCNGVKCGRAAVAAKKAVGWGYAKVNYYALGMEDWKAKGLPLVTK